MVEIGSDNGVKEKGNVFFIFLEKLPSHEVGGDIPRFVRLRVSGARPTLNELASNSVTVRQHPLTAIESPMWQSVRMGAASEMVRDQPPPPLCVVSSSEIVRTMPS